MKRYIKSVKSQYGKTLYTISIAQANLKKKLVTVTTYTSECPNMCEKLSFFDERESILEEFNFSVDADFIRYIKVGGYHERRHVKTLRHNIFFNKKGKPTNLFFEV